MLVEPSFSLDNPKSINFISGTSLAKRYASLMVSTTIKTRYLSVTPLAIALAESSIVLNINLAFSGLAN